ncbi:hypothetical protein Gpo141_00010867 [Globisporangium polare]
MAGAANFAWANRFSMAYQALAKEFAATPDALDMRVVSDVSHNIAKVETRLVEGKPKKLLVHCSDAHVPAAPPTYPPRAMAAREQKGISIRVASPALMMEEAPESYKNVDDDAGILRKAVRLQPIVAVKGDEGNRKKSEVIKVDKKRVQL